MQTPWVLVEKLLTLEPARTYPTRAARLVAEALGATHFELETEAGDIIGKPPLDGGGGTTLPLSNAGRSLGELTLYFGRAKRPTKTRLTQAARALGAGLYATERLVQAVSGERTAEDIQCMLDRTPLAPREREVVAALLRGETTPQIAEHLGLTISTITTYLKRIFVRMRVNSRTELMAKIGGTFGAAAGEATPERRPRRRKA